MRVEARLSLRPLSRVPASRFPALARSRPCSSLRTLLAVFVSVSLCVCASVTEADLHARTRTRTRTQYIRFAGPNSGEHLVANFECSLNLDNVCSSLNHQI